MVDRVPAFQLGGPGSIPYGANDFNLYPETGRVTFVCVPSCVVSGDCPDILLTTYLGRLALLLMFSVLVPSLAPPTGFWSTGICVVNHGRCKLYSWDGKYQKKKQIKKNRQKKNQIKMIRIF